MGIMVFKRTVFETRKRPKGLLRPKTRTNLKDAATVCGRYAFCLTTVDKLLPNLPVYCDAPDTAEYFLMAINLLYFLMWSAES